MRGALSRGVWNKLDGLLAFGATGLQSDGELLGRFVARRDAAAEAAFAALVERYGPMVLGVCRRVLGDRHEAEDAFQATFLVLARKAASIARPEQLANWLFGVAYRTALGARAREGRRKARERRVHAISRSQNTPAGDEEPVLAELRAILDQELARLPERYRGALVLCELDGLTRRAAARRLGIPEGTLSSRIARAKDLLRRRLAGRDFTLSALGLDRAFACENQARTLVVPLSLVDSTIRSATRVAAGAVLAEAASTSIATLAQGVLKAMLLTNVKQIVLGLATLAAITAGAGGLAQGPLQVAASGTHKGQKDSVAVAQPPKTMRPLVLPGSTQFDPTRLSRVRARFAPARVVEVARVWDFPQKSGRPEHRELRPGDSVKKGDVLAVFYSTDVASKKNDLLNALVQLELDEQILDRAEKNRSAVPEAYILTQVRAVQGDRNAINRALNNLKSWDIPQDEIDAVFAEAKKISADKDAWFKTPEGRWTKRKKQDAGGEVDPHHDAENPWGRVALRADQDGVVVERSIHVGEMVVDNTVNVIQIADVSRFQVVANCPEDALPALEALDRGERKWTVRTAGAASDAAHSGTIDEIGFVIDPNQHTAVIKGYVENPGQRIRPGQYVTVTVNIPAPDDVVEIPADALVDDGEQSLVFVQPDPANRQFTMRRVVVAQRHDDKVLVRSTPIPKEEQLTPAEAERGLLPKVPLRPGERVLLTGVMELKRVMTDLESRHQEQPADRAQRARAGSASGPESVEQRLGALERKVDQVLDALRALSRAAATKSDLHETDADAPAVKKR
jgi:cobalt-zinc-cadmium efflux system membrane fusion protein